MIIRPQVRVQLPAALGYFMNPPLGQLRYRGAYGGRGSTKSWTVARALLIHAASQRLRVLCGRQFQSSIRDSVHRLLWDQLIALGLGNFYTVTQTMITGENGSEFLFKGLQKDIQEIKSTEGVDVAWVEEAQAVSEEGWRLLIPTIRKPGSEIWLTFNPELTTDPTWRRFVEETPHRSMVRKVTFRDNPWLPAVLREEEQQLLRRDPEAHANVWDGEPWSRSDAVILAGKWRVQDFTSQPHWQGPYFGQDFGFAQDPSVLVKCWVGDSRLWLEYDEGAPQLDNDGLERTIRGVPGAAEHTIRGDSARPETIHELAKRGLHIVAAPKWAGSVEDGIAHLRSYECLVIHPRCQRALREARLYRYATDAKSGDVLPRIIDAHNHVWDAVRYALAPLIRHRLRPQILTALPARK